MAKAKERIARCELSLGEKTVAQAALGRVCKYAEDFHIALQRWSCIFQGGKVVGSKSRGCVQVGITVSEGKRD